MTEINTRFTTGCGHSWSKHWHPVRILKEATTDCPVCGALLIIPAEQFEGMDPESYPLDVVMPLFHKYMSQQDPGWPEDGAGTGYVEF